MWKAGVDAPGRDVLLHLLANLFKPLFTRRSDAGDTEPVHRDLRSAARTERRAPGSIDGNLGDPNAEMPLDLREVFSCLPGKGSTG